MGGIGSIYRKHFIFKILSRKGSKSNAIVFLLPEDTDLSVACTAKYKVAGLDDPETKIALPQVAQSTNIDTADMESQRAAVLEVTGWSQQCLQERGCVGHFYQRRVCRAES